MLPKMIAVIREGQGEEQRTNKVCAIRFNAFKQRETAKQRERCKQKAKPVHTNMTTQDQKYNKKCRHKISKPEVNKIQQHHKTNYHVQIDTHSKP